MFPEAALGESPGGQRLRAPVMAPQSPQRLPQPLPSRSGGRAGGNTRCVPVCWRAISLNIAQRRPPPAWREACQGGGRGGGWSRRDDVSGSSGSRSPATQVVLLPIRHLVSGNDARVCASRDGEDISQADRGGHLRLPPSWSRPARLLTAPCTPPLPPLRSALYPVNAGRHIIIVSCKWELQRGYNAVARKAPKAW